MINHQLTKKLSEISAEQLSAIYQQVFNNDAGRLVLEDLRHRCFVFMPTESDKDEGKRTVILTIETLINPAPKEPEPAGEAPAQGES